MSSIVEEAAQVCKIFVNWHNKKSIGNKIVDYKGLSVSQPTKEMIDRANEWILLKQAYPRLKVNAFIHPGDVGLAQAEFGICATEVIHLSNMGLLQRDKDNELVIRPVFIKKVIIFATVSFLLIAVVFGICFKTLMSINNGADLLASIALIVVGLFTMWMFSMLYRFMDDQMRADNIIKKSKGAHE